jgi:VCBS repeat-containing protein
MTKRPNRRRNSLQLEPLELRQLLTAAPVAVPDVYNLQEDGNLVLTPQIETIVARGDVWKYLDDGSDQGTGWIAPSFDDSGWASGASELGYGDNDEATEVGFGPDENNKYPTTYFRRTFNVSEDLDITALTMELLRDDGAVVYLNGTEVARDNVPAGAQYNTYASANSQDNEITSFVIDPALLVAGDNVFAVEVHQDSGTSSDISFDLRLHATIGFVGLLSNDTDEDGDILTAELVDAPQHGILSLNSDGTFSYFPDPNFSGTDTFTYRASDGGLDSNVATVTLNIASVNDIPQAGANNYHTLTADTLNVPVESGVLVDDFDFEGQALTAVLVENVSHGTLTLNANGSFTYVANAGYEGTDTFQYSASDGIDQSPPATVSILVTATNSPPETAPDQYSVAEDGTLEITLASVPERVEIFSSNFDEGLPGGFTGITTLAGVEGLAGRGPTGNVFAGSFLRNAANPPQNNAPGPATTLTLTDLPPHTNVSIGFLLALLDQWDGNESFGGFFQAFDRFNVTVDGLSVFSHTISSTDNNQSYVPPVGGEIFKNLNLFSGGNNEEAAYDMYLEPSLQMIPHSSPTLTISFYGDMSGYRRQNFGGGGREPESWAIDNLSITLGREPVTTVTREEVIASGAVWSYLDDGSDQGTAWRQPEFDDAAWGSGPAQLGYGDGDEATNLSFGPDANDKYPTTYFRRSFTVTDVASITGLELDVLRDDGAIVYINGQEVLADNVASGAAYNEYSSTTTQIEADFLSYTISPDALVEGENVIAVEVHQADGQSSDVSFDLRLRTLKADGAGASAFGVLQNDSDPEGGSLTAQLVSGTSHGSLTFNADGTFVYTPNPNYHGTDSFVYRARDSYNSGSEETVTITVIPGPNEPPIVLDKSYSATEDTVLVVGGGTGLLVGATDEDDDPMTAALHTAPQHGTVSITPSGSFQYTPNSNFFGTDTFLYVANDTLADSEPATVTITVAPVPDAPIAVNDLYFVEFGSSIAPNAATGVLANDSDGDNDPMTAQLISNVTNGTLVFNPNGSFSYNPNPGFHATDSFTYRVTDGGLQSSVATVTIRVDSTPVANADSYAVIEDTTFNVRGPQGVLANDTDLENDRLTAVLVNSPTHGQLTLVSDGGFTYVPSANYFGTDSFTYRANDGDQLSPPVTVTLSISAVNDAPVATDDSYGVAPNESITIGAANGLLNNDSDVDSSTLTVALVPDSGPTHGTLELNADGSFTYTPDPDYLGPDSFSYTTTDGLLTSTPATVIIDVSEPTDVVISEIMYHPQSENSLEEWIEFYNRGQGTVNLAGWEISRGVSFTFPDMLLPSGQYLIVAADVAAFTAANPGVTSTVIGGWTGQLSNTGEDIELETASGARVDIVSYADEGDWADRRTANGGWDWIAQHDGGGRSLEVISVQADNEGGQNWDASTVVGGTPGRVNTVASTDLAPFIYDVKHSPAVPQPGDIVTVKADLSDDGEGPITATLFYRVSVANPGAFQQAPMFDDGAHGDGEANDGTFGAFLPPQADGTIVEFYVQATDDQSNSRTWPAPTDNAGTQGANALYQVDTEAYDGTQPIYRMILTPTEFASVAPTGVNRQSDALRNATFINVDGTSSEIRYLTGVRFRGNGSRGTGNLANYRVNIPSDDPWQGIDAINLNSQYSYGQLLGMTLFEMAGMIQEDATAVQLRMNGTQYATTNVQQGSYVHLEVTNSDWVDNHLPNDPAANVYRGINNSLEYNGGNVNTFRNQFNKQTNSSEDDWSDIIAVTRALDPQQTPDAVFVETLEQVANVDQWLRWLAMNALLVNEENGLVNGQGDDWSIVCGKVDPRCQLLVHDLDTILAQGDNSAATARVDRDLFEPRLTDAFNRILNVPEYLDMYWYHLNDLATTVFSPEVLEPVIHNLYDGWVNPTIIDAMLTFNAGRVEYVLQQYALADRTQNIIPLATLIGEPSGTLTQNSVIMRVTGRGVSTYEYRVNGGEWSAPQPVSTFIRLNNLPDGEYALEVVGISPGGVRQREATQSKTWVIDTDYSQIVINEVLAENVSAYNHEGRFSDAIELFNRGTTEVDLSGMSITDDSNDPTKYVFPAGTTLGGGQYLVLHANAPDGTSGLHLGFSLDNDGERISLYDASQNLLDTVKYGIQIPDMSISRNTTFAFNLSTPTLGAVNRTVSLGSNRSLRINEWLADGNRFSNDDFIEIHNTATTPVALGGLYLTDTPVGWKDRHQIAPLSFIAPGAYQVMLADDNEEVGANHVNFNLNANRDSIALYDGNLQLIDLVVVMPQTTDVSQGRSPDGARSWAYFGLPTPGAANIEYPGAGEILQRLRITEIMYHPLGDNENAEYIEFQNIGNLPVDISGVRIRSGVTFTFPNTVVQPGEFVLIVNDLPTFESVYGAGLPVVGEFDGNLSNGGEEIAIILPSPLDVDVIRFEYNDSANSGWPTAPDGFGRSLVVRDTEGDYSSGANWRASSVNGGTPGAAGFTAVGDFNTDGLLDLVDLDALYSQIRSGVYVTSFDLTGDGQLNRLDLEDWLLNRKMTLLGDVNLDLSVDASDWNMWFTHRFMSATSYGQGDLNADGVVDVRDWNIINENKFTSAAAPAATARVTPRAALASSHTSFVVDAAMQTRLASQQRLHSMARRQGVTKTIDTTEQSLLDRVLADW